jgi:hypothetical protein
VDTERSVSCTNHARELANEKPNAQSRLARIACGLISGELLKPDAFAGWGDYFERRKCDLMIATQLD